jgi:hypothetical protein
MMKRKGLTKLIPPQIFALLLTGFILIGIFFVVKPLIELSIIDRCWGNFVSDTGKLSLGIYMHGYKNQTLDFGSCTTGMFFMNKGQSDDLGPYFVFKEIVRNAEKEIRDNEKRDIPLLETIFDECNEEKEAFIIATPWFGEDLSIGGPLIWIVGGATIGYFATGGATKFSGILPVVGAVAGGVGAKEIRDKLVNYIDSVEESGKHSICYSMDRPFAMDFDFLPKEEDVMVTRKVNGIDTEVFRPYKGKYCVLLFKGKENYHMEAFKGHCADNVDNVDSAVEALKESEREGS